MSEDYKFQVTVSLPPVAQYAKGDMVNVRANTGEELVANLDALASDLVANSLARAVGAVRSAEAAVGLTTVAPGTVTQGPIIPGPEVPAAPPAPQPAPPTVSTVPAPAGTYQKGSITMHPGQTSPKGTACFHGTYVWGTGVAKKTGKPYGGYFCPENERGCAVEWPERS